MKVEVTSLAKNELKSLRGNPVYRELKRVILFDLAELDHPSEHPEYKTLRQPDYFRIRVQNYRIGCRLLNHSVLVCRIGHRSVIYQDFP